MFKCGYCGKDFETLAERCSCETECGKKREEEARRKEQEKLAQSKKSRDEDIAKAFECLVKQINDYHSDYSERCSVERQTGQGFIFDYLNTIDPFLKLWVV